MKITVNEHLAEFAEGTTLGTVLTALGLARPGTAVAVDNKVVPTAERDAMVLHDGAKVLIIEAVCGG